MPEQKKERGDEKPAQTAEHAQPDSREYLHREIIAYRLSRRSADALQGVATNPRRALTVYWPRTTSTRMVCHLPSFTPVEA